MEAEAVGSFWESRNKGKLRTRAEKLGQELLGLFAKAKLAERGAAIREATSGIGFVDVLMTFSSGLLHVVELKILKGATLPGPSQLATYMKQKKRNKGWLVLFDSRKPGSKGKIPVSIVVGVGTIRTVAIDINPTPPHKVK